MKTILLFCIMLSSCLTLNAQISESGLPYSLRNNSNAFSGQQHIYNMPDPEAINKIKSANSRYDFVAFFTPMDIKFPQSGTFIKSVNGSRIWKTQIRIDGAPAIGLYYDMFRLPKGVKYYITNASGTQILGAYSSSNNSKDFKFANEPVQGSIVNLELNINPEVDMSAINFHINNAAVYFGGIAYLKQYVSEDIHRIDETDTFLAGRSSVCMINAICPLGENYPVQRKATMSVLFPIAGQGLSACSGTMINNTTNSPENCKQYLLTASHCEPSNSISDQAFSNILVRFNFETADCNSTAIVQAKTITGANFIARSSFDDNAPAEDTKGDFLLLELNDKIPDPWNITLSGWNNNPAHDTFAVTPQKLIGFHHPNGDMKKVSSARNMQSGSFGNDTVSQIHWVQILDSGLVASGSSGSGLFDGDGYLIGIASLASAINVTEECKKNAANENVYGVRDKVYYAKFSYGWEYPLDGGTSTSQLKPWLDPLNSGAVTLKPLDANCTELGAEPELGININNTILEENISLYPNPSRDGRITARFNFKDATQLNVEVYDVTGSKKKTLQLKNVENGHYIFDFSNLTNGMYLLKFGNDKGFATKKIVINR